MPSEITLNLLKSNQYSVVRTLCKKSGFAEATVKWNALSHLYPDFLGGASGKEPTCQCRRHETWVWSLGREDALEESMATHCSILAWRIPMDRVAWGATEPRVAESQTQLKRLSTYVGTPVTTLWEGWCLPLFAEQEAMFQSSAVPSPRTHSK